MALVLPTDNAVVDYSIINEIVNVINEHDNIINRINGNQSSAANLAGGTTVITYGGVIPATSATTSATSKLFKLAVASLPMTTVKAVIGIANTGHIAQPSRCWLVTQTGTTIEFGTDSYATSVSYIAWGIA